MTEQYRVTTSDGKYTAIVHNNGSMTFLRYGEPWPAADQFAQVGMILALVQDLQQLRFAFTPPEGVTLVNLNDPANLHNALKKVLGE